MKILLYTLAFLLLISCNTTNSEAPSIANKKMSLAHTFGSRDEYHLSDFKLTGNFSYWEIRKNNLNPEHTDSVLLSYRNDTITNLNRKQRARLSDVDLNSGFLNLCYPAACPIYGVALIDNTTFNISTDSNLLAFFGDINTEAELNIWLWAHDYQGQSYEKMGTGGYRVVANWDNHCGIRERNLVNVDNDGKVTKLKTLSIHEYDSCR